MDDEARNPTRGACGPRVRVWLGRLRRDDLVAARDTRTGLGTNDRDRIAHGGGCRRHCRDWVVRQVDSTFCPAYRMVPTGPPRARRGPCRAVGGPWRLDVKTGPATSE